MRFHQKKVLVTGGSRGIGRAVAMGFAAEGADVAINYCDTPSEEADATVSEICSLGRKALGIHADVSRPQAVLLMVEQVIEAFGRIDVLVNNAGICPFADFFEMSPDLWTRVIDVNLKGLFLCTQAAAREMKATGGGAIVNVSSISAMVGSATQVHYCSSKGGVNAFTKAAAVALAPYDIRVNGVMPGTVETDINRGVLNDRQTRAQITARTPLGRLGAATDLVGAVLYLASDDAGWTTGALLPVDGGYVAG